MKKRDLILIKNFPFLEKRKMERIIGGSHFNPNDFFKTNADDPFTTKSRYNEARIWCYSEVQRAMIDHESLIVVTDARSEDWDNAYFQLAALHNYDVHKISALECTDENDKSTSKTIGIMKDRIEKLVNPRYNKEIFDDADLMTIEEWEHSKDLFSNFDGVGYWVKENLRSNDEVFLTDRKDATHVVWYSK